MPIKIPLHQSKSVENCDQFKTTIGVLQGCVLSPLYFNIFLELIIATALEDEGIGVQIGGVRINNLYFADDTALLAESPNELQAMVNRVVEVSENLGMESKHRED